MNTRCARLIAFILLITSFSTHAVPILNCRCQPNNSCWPKEADWKMLNQELGGRLIKAQSPIKACAKDITSDDCQKTLKLIRNPFYLESQPGGSQTTGWYKAWTNSPSQYVVKAKTTEHIAAAVKFAHEHKLRLAIKATGHDYLGRSNAPNSLLIWTHDMRDVTINPRFKPLGCDKKTKPVSAVTVSAGTRWLEAYKKVVVDNNRYVQGGGCTSVGAAGGFIQGGGFGSFSKKFGIAASNILQAEIVTANGEVIIANRCQHPDLFWALKGGGGGTFGVVSHLTIKTYPLPKTFGIYQGKIQAKSDKAYKQLIKTFLGFYRTHLNNPNWGEQAALNPNNRLDLFMVFQGINKAKAEKTWASFNQFLKKNKKDYQNTYSIRVMPARKMWDYRYLKKHFPQLITLDPRKGQPKGQYWWTPNQGEVSKYLAYYKGRYIPSGILEAKSLDKTTDVFFNASRLVSFSLHFNKGQHGADKDAISRGKNTAMHPKVFDAVGLLIMSSGEQYRYPNVKSLQPNEEELEKSIEKADKAFAMIKDLTPNAGSYANEADYFETDWQNTFWGDNYQKLLKIKTKYDPKGLFYCHHCVGSEFWDNKGVCKIQ